MVAGRWSWEGGSVVEEEAVGEQNEVVLAHATIAAIGVAPKKQKGQARSWTGRSREEEGASRVYSVL
jgi:hypothetical protein